MTAFFVIVIIAAILFALAFVSKRRFGILGLGLAAGTLLSTYWTGTVSNFLTQQGITLVAPPLSAVVATGLLFGPPLLLLASGPSYSKLLARVIGGVLFAAMGTIFILPILTSALVADAKTMEVLRLADQYGRSIVALLIAYAVFDVMLAHSRKPKQE